MNEKTNEEILITKVANGYMVKNPFTNMGAPFLKEIYVFETIESLFKYLRTCYAKPSKETAAKK